MNKKYVHYGCGLAAPKEWTNFDVSPTLRMQKSPILGRLIRSRLNVVFPDNVKYGDIIKGLPVAENSCEGVYCSHTLEHLSLNECRIALKNTYKILKPRCIFRCVVPDLEILARTYIDSLENGNAEASVDFISGSILGTVERPRGFKGFVRSFFGNVQHLWMWDRRSLQHELERAGFKNIRECKAHDSADDLFKLVESEDRFVDAVALECRK